MVRVLLDAETPAVTIVGKTWPMQVTGVLGVTLEENLAMIADTVRYLKSKGREVLYDAEHFFDSFRVNRNYALQTILAAQASRASRLEAADDVVPNEGSLSALRYTVDCLHQRYLILAAARNGRADRPS